MAQLNTDQRRALWAALMQELSREGETVSINKTDLRAAVNALDAWLDTNASTINASIPQPARGALSVTQKALLLMFVVNARYIQEV